MNAIEVMTKEIKIKHIDITREAKFIFGELIEQAYIAMPKWSDEHDFLRNEKVACEVAIEPEDGYPVLIKFTNGKAIKLTSSEWGGIYSITEDEYLRDTFAD